MSKADVDYSYMTDGCECAVWTGSEDTAVARAVDELGATELDSGDFAYLAEETDTYYTVYRPDLAELGAALLDGRALSDVYSMWCASCGREADASEVAELADIEVIGVRKEHDADDGPDELAAYVAVGVTVDGRTYEVSTMVGVPEHLWGTVEAAGCGVRPHCDEWQLDSCDLDEVPHWSRAAVAAALCASKNRLWREVEALRENA